MRALVALATILALAPACALTSRGDAREWQWFTPERVRPRLTSGVVGAGPPVQLRRVTSGTDLGRRIIFGDGAYEVGYYEQRRWTDAPELYVRRALERTLCQEQGLQCEPSGSAPTLDVEVLRFQEVKAPKSHQALVALRFVLSSERVLVDDTVQVAEPVTGSTFDDVVAAISRALDSAANQVASRVALKAHLAKPQ
jgi:cholesterol transport system auxiliary component